jgi:hypothetical protein
MIHDPALALHTVKQAQQEHRDIAGAHRLVRTGAARVRSPRPPRRLSRLGRPALSPLGLRRHLTTP